MENRNYIIATDYMRADGETDVSAVIQNIIDENPNRTIFFPDGVYLLGQPILTPAHPKRSVDLQLSNFACFKATEAWRDRENGEAVRAFSLGYGAIRFLVKNV